jgi:uncharacterized protein YggU (UPF0235/DUF167 family)
MTAGSAALTAHDGHALVTVRLTPNARDERIEGVKTLADGRQVLAARVRAVPEDGAANQALEKLLAKAVGIARSRVSLVSGATQRIKIVKIEADSAAVSLALGL